MKIDFMPKTRSGKWSVWLNAFFLIAITISILLVMVLKILSFEDHWWDITVAVIFPASIIALITGVLAARKHEERSILVKASMLIGVLTVLFIFLHSLFIND
jgi:membrane-associated HD superfamily phosphohydrolase